MKPLYILIVIIIIAAAGWYFLSNDETTPEADTAPAMEESSTATSDDSEMSDMEMGDDSMEESMPSGSDAGMEFPTIDAGMEGSVEGAGVDAEGSLGMEIDENAKVFTVSGSNFAFNVTEIRVQQGDTVTINFTSADGFHDWVVDEFDAATAKVQTGNSTSVTFVADRKGTFEYYCSVGNHRDRGMVGSLIVE